MTQEHVSPATPGKRTLAKVLVAAVFPIATLGIPTATAAAEPVAAPSDHPVATAAAQTGPDRTAPCRRWQNPNAYGHWHCR
ncbi:hypothetical protein [Rhodococcus sp. (in: high G+C Gram-positive bacteria)]|uniref:hypothetical protein n=1 Tax=Rhodococcus sp. TaxID=1831 RepID=UPI003B8A7B77